MTVYSGPIRAVAARVEVENALGTMVSLNDLLGIDWVASVEVSANVNARSRTATVSLFREVANPDSPGEAISLAPLLEGSAANAGGALLAAGRRIRISFEVGEVGSAPSSFVEMVGILDDPSWGGIGSSLQLTARDLLQVWHDVWIEEEKEYGGTEADPVPLQDVIQQVMDDNLPATFPSLSVVGDPDFAVLEYTQQTQSLADAIHTGLVDNTIGWEIRHLPGPGDGTIELFEPDVEKTVPDIFLTDDELIDVTSIEEDTTAIRNVVKVLWADEDGVEQTPAIVEDQDSINRLASDDDTGRRYIQFDARGADSQLKTSARVNRFAEAALRDLSTPPLDIVATGRLRPGIRLGDLIRIEPNALYNDVPIDVGLVGFSHRVTAGSESTTNYQLRGRVSGGNVRWIRRAERDRDRRDNVTDNPNLPEPPDPPDPPPPFGPIEVYAGGDGRGEISGNGNERTSSWRVAASTFSPPTEANVDSGMIINGRKFDPSDVGPLIVAAPGETIYVAARAYENINAEGEAGLISRAQARYGLVEGEVPTGELVGRTLAASSRKLRTTVEFSPLGPSEVAWTGGSVTTLGSAQILPVSSGSLSDITATTYIYRGTGPSGTLQNTTSFAVANLEGNLLMAVVRPAASQEGGAAIFAVGDGSSDHINAAYIDVLFLRALAADIGLLDAGSVQSPQADAGIFFGPSADETAPDSVPGGWEDFVNLTDPNADKIRFSDSGGDPIFRVTSNGDLIMAGVLNSGLIVAPDQTAAILVGGNFSLPPNLDAFLNLQAEGADPILKHFDLELRADGTRQWPAEVRNTPELSNLSISGSTWETNPDGHLYRVTWTAPPEANTNWEIDFHFIRNGVELQTILGVPINEPQPFENFIAGGNSQDLISVRADLIDGNGDLVSTRSTRDSQALI